MNAEFSILLGKKLLPSGFAISCRVNSSPCRWPT